INDLRGTLTNAQAQLAAAEAQLPCPEVVQETVVTETAPLMSTVRFKLNSAVISSEEAVNVYNTAQWLKANPEEKVVIVGYADKDTGTPAYNLKLSQRRAQAVRDMLVNKYGISSDRLTTQAEGSNVQPYDVNNWNRIVIFSVAK
ncbi:MAG: OmpA family protein, partial [Muribaculaceae bacterium]|nr:OmpA family protein [Muribaculaceae bacterium]